MLKAVGTENRPHILIITQQAGCIASIDVD